MHEFDNPEQTLMYIQKATMFADPLMRLATLGMLKLITHFARMVKEKKLSNHKFKSFQQFANAAGDIDLYNIPIESVAGKTSEEVFKPQLEKLDAAGIKYFVMPDLNENDNFIQLAVVRDDKALFSAWQEQYLYANMQGGEKSIKDLNAFTGANTSIVSMPLENNLETMKKDFKKLNINYSIMPDLKVGDGQIQCMIYNDDLGRAKHWFKLYQEKCLSNGQKVPDLQQMNMTEYQSTSRLTEDEYIDTSSPELKKSLAKYDDAGMENPELKAALTKGKVASSEEFVNLNNNSNYQRFDINDSLMRNDKVFDCFLNEKDLFLSRVPGTYGDNTLFMATPKEDVFFDKHTNTYHAFYKKNAKPYIFTKDLDMVGISKRSSAEELFNSHYKPTTTKNIVANKTMEKIADIVPGMKI